MATYSDYESNPNAGCIGWDDEIADDGQQANFVVLPEGEYDFEVTNFERSSFPGSAKIPPCNKAIYTLKIVVPDGICMIKADIIMYKTLEWKISAFFRCIGQKKHGEPLVPRWNEVVGSKGHAKIIVREYEKDGEKRKTNDVGVWLDPPEWVNEAEIAKETPMASWKKGF